MRAWFKKRITKCMTCGRDHKESGVPIGEIVPKTHGVLTGGFYHQTMIYPGHEYSVIAISGDTRPEVWRLGFLREMYDGQLAFTAARENQEDETVTVFIEANSINSAREVKVDKSARHAGRNLLQEAE